MAGIFKAYDIRGVYPEELNEDIMFDIGRAFVDVMRKELGSEKMTLCVGYDMRDSSIGLEKSLVAGLIAQGADVINVGLVSTPSLYFAVAKLKADGGLMITASHNPAKYNGVKFVRDVAKPFSYEGGIHLVEEKVKNSEFENVSHSGSVGEYKDIVDEEVTYAIDFSKADGIKPLKVVADTANGMSAIFLEKLFEKLPCELIKMYFDLDGSFPNHEADPYKDENVVDLKKRVVSEGADLGIATDGDGDRIFFIDNKGEMVEPAILRGILSKIFLREHPGATICYDIRPGMITQDMIVENGGKPVVTRVGHSLIKEKGLSVGAIFAGESSGHFFVNTEYGFYETPAIVTLKILEEISNFDGTFADMVNPLRRYFHSGEINSEVEDKEAVMDKLKEVYSEGELNELDGITITFDEWWFNVRPSNTEPKLRLNLEARTKEVMEEKRDEVLKVIRG